MAEFLRSEYPDAMECVDCLRLCSSSGERIRRDWEEVFVARGRGLSVLDGSESLVPRWGLPVLDGEKSSGEVRLVGDDVRSTLVFRADLSAGVGRLAREVLGDELRNGSEIVAGGTKGVAVPSGEGADAVPDSSSIPSPKLFLHELVRDDWLGGLD